MGFSAFPRWWTLQPSDCCPTSHSVDHVFCDGRLSLHDPLMFWKQREILCKLPSMLQAKFRPHNEMRTPHDLSNTRTITEINSLMRYVRTPWKHCCFTEWVQAQGHGKQNAWQQKTLCSKMKLQVARDAPICPYPLCDVSRLKNCLQNIRNQPNGNKWLYKPFRIYNFWKELPMCALRRDVYS